MPYTGLSGVDDDGHDELADVGQQLLSYPNPLVEGTGYVSIGTSAATAVASDPATRQKIGNFIQAGLDYIRAHPPGRGTSMFGALSQDFAPKPLMSQNSGQNCGQTPEISQQKQDAHNPDTKENNRRKAAGKPTSTFNDAKEGEALTQDTHATARSTPTRK